MALGVGNMAAPVGVMAVNPNNKDDGFSPVEECSELQ